MALVIQIPTKLVERPAKYNPVVDVLHEEGLVHPWLLVDLV